jgi:hypothetical protein
MKEALDKVIKRLLLRKYPFIKDSEINVNVIRLGFGNPKKLVSEKYIVTYTVTPNEDGELPSEDEFTKVIELTETLFKMLGPKDYQKLSPVEFYINED